MRTHTTIGTITVAVGALALASGLAPVHAVGGSGSTPATVAFAAGAAVPVETGRVVVKSIRGPPAS